MEVTPSASYSVTLRVEIANRPGTLGKLTSRIGDKEQFSPGAEFPDSITSELGCIKVSVPVYRDAIRAFIGDVQNDLTGKSHILYIVRHFRNGTRPWRGRRTRLNRRCWILRLLWGDG